MLPDNDIMFREYLSCQNNGMMSDYYRSMIIEIIDYLGSRRPWIKIPQLAEFKAAALAHVTFHWNKMDTDKSTEIVIFVYKQVSGIFHQQWSRMKVDKRNLIHKAFIGKP